MSWEEVADAAARKAKDENTTVTSVAHAAYFAAVQAGWTGPLSLWFETVWRRAHGTDVNDTESVARAKAKILEDDVLNKSKESKA